MKATIPVALYCIFAFIQPLSGQDSAVNRSNFRLQAKKTDQGIEVDGILDEAIWSRAERTTPFHRITPTDTGYAKSQTEVMIAYDETNIYMGIILHDTMPGKRPMESYRRDWNFGKNDNFLLPLTLITIKPMDLHLGFQQLGGNGMASNPTGELFPWTGMANGTLRCNITGIAG